ncbi:sulfite exporter TauE/SafE family protein [Chloroflexota bacterium]
MLSFPQRSTVNKQSVLYSIIYLLITGAGAGMLAGFLGLAGGVILVPIMVGLLGFNQHCAHGTSLFIITPVALTGAIFYALRGDIDWMLVATIGPTSIIGVIVGAKLMTRISAMRLRQSFGVYTVVVAILMLLK